MVRGLPPAVREQRSPSKRNLQRFVEDGAVHTTASDEQKSFLSWGWEALFSVVVFLSGFWDAIALCDVPA